MPKSLFLCLLRIRYSFQFFFSSTRILMQRDGSLLKGDPKIFSKAATLDHHRASPIVFSRVGAKDLSSHFPIQPYLCTNLFGKQQFHSTIQRVTHTKLLPLVMFLLPRGSGYLHSTTHTFAEDSFDN